jgi:hypothetical protein
MWLVGKENSSLKSSLFRDRTSTLVRRFLQRTHDEVKYPSKEIINLVYYPPYSLSE